MMKLLSILLLFLTFNLSAQQEFEICENSKAFTYSTTIDMNGTVSWFLDGTPIGSGLNATITYDEPGEFQLVAIGYNDLGCPGTPQVLNIIVTQCDPLIYWIPNSFTPDGNEFNQLWGPILTSGFSSDNYELKVYNRWGAVIWESHDINAKWDGTYGGVMVPDGTYDWVMKLYLNDTDGKKLVTGHVTILK